MFQSACALNQWVRDGRAASGGGAAPAARDVGVVAPVPHHLLARPGQVVEHPGDELENVPAGDGSLGVIGSGGARAVKDLARVLIQRQALEHHGTADHVAAQAGGRDPIGDRDLGVDREAGVAPAQQVVDDLLRDQILLGLVIGGGVGAVAARTVAMTGMPEMVALFNGTGGLASLLVGWAEYHQRAYEIAAGEPVAFSSFTLGSVFLASLIGGITFTGSVIAWGKLSGKVPGKPILFPGQQFVNIILLIVAVAAGVAFSLVLEADAPLMMAKSDLYMIIVAVSLILGVLAVIGIGGADMPVVIALLNSYSGLAACATGFIIVNKVLIVSGALVGASGLILTSIMCKAMNRSITNVLFSGFGATTKKAAGVTGEAKIITAEDAYLVLEAASSVVFVPGYGMAVAQAQHAVRELGELLEENGADRARTTFVLKRSLGAGYAGIDNPLFFKENVRMLLGDAKASVSKLVAEFKGE